MGSAPPSQMGITTHYYQWDQVSCDVVPRSTCSLPAVTRSEPTVVATEGIRYPRRRIPTARPSLGKNPGCIHRKTAPATRTLTVVHTIVIPYHLLVRLTGIYHHLFGGSRPFRNYRNALDCSVAVMGVPPINCRNTATSPRASALPHGSRIFKRSPPPFRNTTSR